jgi:hypothetical protein
LFELAVVLLLPGLLLLMMVVHLGAVAAAVLV